MHGSTFGKGSQRGNFANCYSKQGENGTSIGFHQQNLSLKSTACGLIYHTTNSHLICAETYCGHEQGHVS